MYLNSSRFGKKQNANISTVRFPRTLTTALRDLPLRDMEMNDSGRERDTFLGERVRFLWKVVEERSRGGT